MTTLCWVSGVIGVSGEEGGGGRGGERLRDREVLLSRPAPRSLVAYSLYISSSSTFLCETARTKPLHPPHHEASPQFTDLVLIAYRKPPLRKSLRFFPPRPDGGDIF